MLISPRQILEDLKKEHGCLTECCHWDTRLFKGWESQSAPRQATMNGRKTATKAHARANTLSHSLFYHGRNRLYTSVTVAMVIHQTALCRAGPQYDKSHSYLHLVRHCITYT